MMKPLLLRMVIAMIPLCVAATASAAEAPAGASVFVTTRVSVTGAVQRPLDLGVEDLHRFPVQHIGKVAITTHSGDVRGEFINARGVRVRDLLEAAEIIAPGHNDVKKMIVIAGASDDYKVVFSWSELFNSAVGDGVLVLFEEDGRPLSDHEGRLALVSTTDIRTGPRHVRWLQSIEVRKVAD